MHAATVSHNDEGVPAEGRIMSHDPPRDHELGSFDGKKANRGTTLPSTITVSANIAAGRTDRPRSPYSCR